MRKSKLYCNYIIYTFASHLPKLALIAHYPINYYFFLNDFLEKRINKNTFDFFIELKFRDLVNLSRKYLTVFWLATV